MGEILTSLSLLECKGMQFFHCGAVVSEMINGCSNGREGEGVEWRGNHAVQEVDSAQANGDVRDVMISAVLRNKHGDVVNQRRDNIGVLGGVVTNAAALPLGTVNGATASINSCCSLSRSAVGSTTMLPNPRG